jgi:hypothetical protein
LFEAILKQEEYDEEALKKKLKYTKLINNFSAAKKLFIRFNYYNFFCHSGK